VTNCVRGLSIGVFETYDAIVEAACKAWRNLLAEPSTITSCSAANLSAQTVFPALDQRRRYASGRARLQADPADPGRLRARAAVIEGRPPDRNFITGAAQSVTNSVERLTALRKAHPEWNEALTPKAAARERLTTSTKSQSAPRVNPTSGA
jgi:hypothetical protein